VSWARPALLIDLGTQARAFQQRRGPRVRGRIRRPQISEFDARGHDVLESSVDAYLDNKRRCVTQVFIGHYLFKIDRAHGAPEMSDHEPPRSIVVGFPNSKVHASAEFRDCRQTTPISNRGSIRQAFQQRSSRAILDHSRDEGPTEAGQWVWKSVTLCRRRYDRNAFPWLGRN
jgi:hypothetical protein